MTFAVVGTGVMGTAIADRLLQGRGRVAVWNRTPSRADPLGERGARIARSLPEAVLDADIVVTSVTDDAALKEIVGGDSGILAGLSAGAVHCDTSTVSPVAACAVAERYREADRLFVHAPVLGNKKHAASGELLVFAGGQSQARKAAKPVLELLSAKIWEFEDPGSAAALKLSCNLMIASMITALSQSLVFAAKQGVDPHKLVDVLQNSALGCPMYASKSRQILERDWNANFVVDNLIKDLTLAEKAGRDADVPLPLAALVQQFFVAASVKGYGSEDYSAVCKVFEELAGTDVSRQGDSSIGG